MIRKDRDVLGTRDDHPAYGIVSFSRTQCTANVVLVDSAIKHSATIKLRVYRASRNRNFNHYRFHQEGQLIEVEMSPVQFAEAITNMNSEGVPCTLRWIAGEGDIPNPVLDHERDKVVKEFKEDVEHVANSLNEIRDYIDKLSEQTTIRKGDIKTLKDMFRQTKQDIECDLPFVAKQFGETVEKTLSKAKGEFEAYVLHRALHLGSQSLVETSIEGEAKPPTLALEGPDEPSQETS